MFEAAIRSMLGGWGNVVLDFYLEHQLIFNLVVLTWGVAMIVLRRRKKQKAETAPATKEMEK